VNIRKTFPLENAEILSMPPINLMGLYMQRERKVVDMVLAQSRIVAFYPYEFGQKKCSVEENSLT
jgi:hypothetical protein